jgi:DNA-binding SARP family transcriptional activator
MPVLELRLFGDFRMLSDAGALIAISAKKSQAMLAYLGSKPAQLVSRDKMASLLWSSTAPEQARQSLRQTLSTLRKELSQISSDKKILVEEGDFLALDATNVQVDTAQFESSVAQGTLASLSRAIELYTGDFLDGFEIDEEKFDQWVIAERDRLHRMALRAHAQLVEMHTRDGRLDEAIAVSQASLRVDPLQESVHRGLMKLYVQSGDLTNALQQFDACAKIIRRELSVEPDAETKALHQQIVQLRTRRSATPAQTDQSKRKKTVLVVEDNALNRELANALLKGAGYNVLLANDGADALMLMAKEHVDLMLLDVDLPFIDGHKVLEALREKGIDVPTIFVSGLPGEEPEVKAFEIGAADFIRKPVKNNILLARVSKVLKEA